MRKILLLVVLGTVFSLPLSAGDGLVSAPSKFSVGETMDRFEQAVQAAGMSVFARIDHAKGAAKADMQLAPTELIIFGNPKIGTKLMQSNQRIGIDLPLKALAWQDGQGKVWLDYLQPSDLLARFGIADQPDIQQKMTGALAKFAAAATGQ